MKNKKIISGMSLFLAFLSNLSFSATPIVLSEYEEVFNNQNCHETESCDLVQLKIKHQNYKLWVIDREHFGANAHFFYETKEISQLQNYGFVHSLKGCRYTYTKEKSGLESKLLNFVIRSFNVNALLKFKDWTIDSPDSDPMASTRVDLTSLRHYFYQWNETPYSTDQKTAYSFGDEPPENPVLYLKVLPSQAFESDFPQTAYVNSLQVKTCLYKTSDIPLTGTNNMSFTAQPIHCFYWNNNAEYDFSKKKFENKAGIDPFCLL